MTEIPEDLFGKILRQLRTENDLSVDGLSTLAGLPHEYISMLETSTLQPSLQDLILIAEGLGIEAIDIIDLLMAHIKAQRKSNDVNKPL